MYKVKVKYNYVLYCIVDSETSSEEEDSTLSEEEDSTLSETPSLEQVVQFAAGHPYLPACRLQIKFTSSFFPDPDSCFFSIKLPTCHESYLDFKKAMNTAISCQYHGYGRG